MNRDPQPPSPSPRESELLAAAQRGDEGAFDHLIAPYHGELQAHSYRMLGSLHDAEDAMQETMLRAWRGIAGFEGRSSLRSWLYTIATNSSLRLIERRPKRVLPVDLGPPADPHDELGKPLVESTWIEPFPDERLSSDETETSPAARYEQRESVELAFTAALQRLPGLQRAALILTDVLGFSPAEVAEALDATPASIYSALQRARKATAEDLPSETQQKKLDEIGEDRVQMIIDRFMEAWEAADVEGIQSLLTEDCVLAMPPWSEWFSGREAIAEFLPRGPFQPGEQWRLAPTQANGQPALAAYWLDDEGGRHAESIMVLTLASDGRISEITPFRSPELFSRFGLPRAMDPEDSSDL
jgi:RNA polymerase sigma-70 factor (ECF subfamily)